MNDQLQATSSYPTAANSAGLASTPKKLSETEQEMQRMIGSIDQLHGNLNELSNRLSPVLRVTPPMTGEDSEKEQGLTGLASAIRERRYQIENAARKVRDYINRLEL